MPLVVTASPFVLNANPVMKKTPWHAGHMEH